MNYRYIIFTLILLSTLGLTAENLIENGNFENWNEGLPQSWFLSGSSINATESNAHYHSPSIASQLQWSTSTTRYLYQLVEIEPSTDYYCECWFYDDDPGGRGRIYFTWLDSEGAMISSQGSSEYTEDGEFWVKKTYSATSPEDALMMRVELRCYDVSGWDGDAEIFVDDCWLNQGDDFLPVTLSSFTAAVYLNQYVAVNWVTQSESNLSHFNVYRDSLLVNSQNAHNQSIETDYTFHDNEIEEGSTYQYLLEIVELDGSTSSHGPYNITVQFTEEEEETSPENPIDSELHGNYPNPFNPDTTISFSIKENETGALRIYNIKGQLLLDDRFPSGEHKLHWNAEAEQSGIYLYTLKTNSNLTSKKMTLLK